jgi:hypothetical protein
VSHDDHPKVAGTLFAIRKVASVRRGLGSFLQDGPS